MTTIPITYRYKLIIEYVGTNISGWQYQSNALSIQQIIQEAIYNFSGETAILHAAGRTDAAVHAYGQVAHFDLSRYFTTHRVMQAINHFVRPHLVGIIDCEIVDHNFHARFSATGRHYLYRIINRSGKVIIDHDRAWWIKQSLDIDRMREGAMYLIGKHDFTSFRATQCQAKSPVRTLSTLDIVKHGDNINIYISALSFLHHMVRNIVGSLVLVGNGKWQPQDIKIALEARKREAAGATAPAHGLYFLKVDYQAL